MTPEARIKQLEAELDDARSTRLAIKLVRAEQERDQLRFENSAILEGSAEWEESFHQAKALEKAQAEKALRYKKERDELHIKNEAQSVKLIFEKSLSSILKAENLQMLEQFKIISDHDEAWTHNCNEFVKDMLKLPHTAHLAKKMELMERIVASVRADTGYLTKHEKTLLKELDEHEAKGLK